jgi:Ni/Co efflux regulator RcnB
MVLDRLFWGRNYWLNDPYQYRLPPAPYGYVWVRYYDDVLLVDTYNGRVVDVIHDFFWR